MRGENEGHVISLGQSEAAGSKKQKEDPSFVLNTLQVRTKLQTREYGPLIGRDGPRALETVVILFTFR